MVQFCWCSSFRCVDAQILSPFYQLYVNFEEFDFVVYLIFRTFSSLNKVETNNAQAENLFMQKSDEKER